MPKNNYPVGKALYDAVKTWIETKDSKKLSRCPFDPGHGVNRPCLDERGYNTNRSGCFALLGLEFRCFGGCPCSAYGTDAATEKAQALVSALEQEHPEWREEKQPLGKDSQLLGTALELYSEILRRAAWRPLLPQEPGAYWAGVDQDFFRVVLVRGEDGLLYVTDLLAGEEETDPKRASEYNSPIQGRHIPVDWCAAEQRLATIFGERWAKRNPPAGEESFAQDDNQEDEAPE